MLKLCLVAANTIHSGLVKVGLCRKMVRRYDVGAASASASTLTLQMTPAERADNDRRRHLALKALSERLGQGSSTAATSFSSLDNELSTTSPGVANEWPNLENPKNSGAGATQLETVVVDTSDV